MYLWYLIPVGLNSSPRVCIGCGPQASASDNCIAWVSPGPSDPESPEQGKYLSHWPERWMCPARTFATYICIVSWILCVWSNLLTISKISVAWSVMLWPHLQLERRQCPPPLPGDQGTLHMVPVRIQLGLRAQALQSELRSDRTQRNQLVSWTVNTTLRNLSCIADSTFILLRVVIVSSILVEDLVLNMEAHI